MTASAPLLRLKSVSQRFGERSAWIERAAKALGARISKSTVHALDHVDFHIDKGEVVGLVGESGCGKSTLGRIAAGIMPPTEGEVRFKDRNVETLTGADRTAAALAVQMIFQDPFSSLNPRLPVAQNIQEAPLFHGLVKREDADAYVDGLMRQVGLDPSTRRRYPHQFSGGQRQRIGIARALAVRPEMIVCDEAVASLDVSVQAQVLNLFIELKNTLGLTYLFISHDLSVVRLLSDRVLIMYLGRVVEEGPVEALFKAPNHPYTKALLAEMPRVDMVQRKFFPIHGELPSPLDPPSGCHFHPRCKFVHKRCFEERPVLKEIAPGRRAACHLNDEAPAGDPRILPPAMAAAPA